ncbi:MAG: sialidase family protein, partial [Candidatus Hodarchaeales archaeon]
GVKSNYSNLDSFDLYYKRSLDGGLIWEPEVLLTPDLTHSIRSDIAVTNTGNVSVVWDDDREGLPVRTYIRLSGDNGANWNAPLRLSDDGSHLSLVTDNSNVHLAWMDSVNNRNIFYRISNDAGNTWQAEEQINEFQGSEASTPLLSASNNYLHTVWLDNREGGYYAWYRRRTLNTPPPPTDSPTNTPAPTEPPPTPPTQTPTSIPDIDGDGDNDGDVDMDDYVIWLNNYQEALGGNTNGDYDPDDFVDGLDYIIWLNNFGQ